MVLHAINLGILTVLFFVIGMIKPNWALFFMEKPTRWLVTMIATVFFMITMTMYGEGHRQDELAKKHKKPTTESTAPAPVPVPEPVPVPIPTEKPKQTSVKKK